MSEGADRRGVQKEEREVEGERVLHQHEHFVKPKLNLIRDLVSAIPDYKSCQTLKPADAGPSHISSMYVNLHRHILSRLKLQ